MGIQDKDKRTFADSNELHDGEETEGIFEGIYLTELCLDQDPQAVLKNKMENFDEADLINPTLAHRERMMKQ